MSRGTVWPPVIVEEDALPVVDEHAPPVVQPRDAGHLTISRPGAGAQAAARSLRILVVAPEAPPVKSGIASVVGYLEKGLEGHGHRIDVLAYPDVGRLGFGEIRLSALIFKLPQLLHCIDKYDVIHIHGATPTVSDVALLFAGRRRRHSVVIYTHHMDLAFGSDSPLTHLYNYLHRRLSARADAVVATSRDNLSLLADTGRGGVIALGADVDQFSTSGPEDPQFTVLFIGQFRPYKGVGVLLEAMSHVPGARLLLAGRGPEEQAYRSLAAELGLDVEFHVDVDDPELRQLYRRAHAVVLPAVSRREAFGLVLVEGMAAGCVPIASNLPGVREVVARAGFLFPRGDSTRLGAILHGLRENPSLVKHLADRARIRAAEFSRAHTICEYERLITGLIACRDLKEGLADRDHSYDSALCRFVADVETNFHADWTEIVLCPSQSKLCTVESRELHTFSDHRLQRASSLLAWYAVNTAASTLLGPNDGPLHFEDWAVVDGKAPAAMVAPLTVARRPFGALLLMRERPFEQRDLDDLTCFARYIAPPLYAIVSEGSLVTRRRAGIASTADSGRYTFAINHQ
jgi:glycosyltransferase involved in cell wall biosynthesis